MEANNTPGPWFVANGNKIHDRETKFGENGEQIGNTANEIAMTFYDPTERGTKEANARLIAAAPELLTACESMIDAVMKISAYNIQKFGMFPEVDRMNAAIAKAKGEKQCGK